MNICTVKFYKMETEKLNILKLKYKDNFKTKSDNSSVLLLYSYILEKENVDSDWWNEDHGCNDVVGILERNFSDFDWEMLEKDLENWTLNQIELFTLSIINGSCGNGLFEDLKVRGLQKRYTYEKRLQILIKISKDQTLKINFKVFTAKVLIIVFLLLNNNFTIFHKMVRDN